jgi:hypothetical protein
VLVAPFGEFGQGSLQQLACSCTWHLLQCFAELARVATLHLHHRHVTLEFGEQAYRSLILSYRGRRTLPLALPAFKSGAQGFPRWGRWRADMRHWWRLYRFTSVTLLNGADGSDLRTQQSNPKLSIRHALGVKVDLKRAQHVVYLCGNVSDIALRKRCFSFVQYGRNGDVRVSHLAPGQTKRRHRVCPGFSRF